MKPFTRAVFAGAVSLLGFLAAAPLRAADEKPAATASADLWTTDFEGGLAQAKKEGKLALVDFTGSDWCGWCIRLDEEVFSKKEFISEAPKSFVFIKLDYPQKKKLPEAEKKRNDELAKKYEVQGFPTILMLDGDGKVVGKTGYKEGGPVKYVQHLGELAKRPVLLAKAMEAKGADQARLLGAILAEMSPEEALDGYPKEVDAIIANDADNALGLKAKYQAAKAKTILGEKLQDLYTKKNFDGMLAAVEEYVAAAKPEGEELAQMLMHKLQINLLKANFDQAQALVPQIAKAAPGSVYDKKAGPMIEAAKKRAEAAKAKAADIKVPAGESK